MSTRTRHRVRRVTLAVLKDLALFGIGSALMVHEAFAVPRPDFRWEVMVFGGVLAGAPGVLKIWSGRSTAERSSELPPSPDSPRS